MRGACSVSISIKRIEKPDGCDSHHNFFVDQVAAAARVFVLGGRPGWRQWRRREKCAPPPRYHQPHDFSSKRCGKATLRRALLPNFQVAAVALCDS